MNKETDIAWLAGIMEGEGTFAIYHQGRSGVKGEMLRGTISLTNTDPALINKSYEVFKDFGVEMHIHEYKNKKGSTKPVYDMSTARAENVQKVCENLLPYLFGEKKAKAEMLLRFVVKRQQKRLETSQGKYDDEDWDQFNNFRSSETTRETLKSDDIVHS